MVTLQSLSLIMMCLNLPQKLKSNSRRKKSKKQRALVVAEFSIEAIQQAMGAVRNQPSQHQVQWPNFQPKP
jgi:preprotein translocase subunit SecY